MTKLTASAGQTIMEVLIATVVVATVLTAIAVGLTYSVKNTAGGQTQSTARNYAQEPLELYRRVRSELGWESFLAEMTDGVYCLASLPEDAAALVAIAAGVCGGEEVIENTSFYREATITTDIDAVTVTSEVYWADGADTKQVELTTTFREID